MLVPGTEAGRVPKALLIKIQQYNRLDGIRVELESAKWMIFGPTAIQTFYSRKARNEGTGRQTRF